jgi:hypothetical protein
MKANATIFAIALGSFVLLGCDKPAEQKTPDPAAQTQQGTNAATNPANPAAPTTAAATPTPTAEPIADSDLFTSADFDDEATKAITNKNYKTELASLETDVSKE